MTRLFVLLMLVALGAAVKAQTPAPVPTLAQIIEAQEKVVAAKLAKLRALPEFKEYDEANTILAAMKARLQAETPKPAAKVEPPKAETGK